MRATTPIRFFLTMALTVAAATLHAQNPAEILRPAVDRLLAFKTNETRYTWLVSDRVTNSDSRGHKYFDQRSLYEITWINGLPYNRLLERNGKKLKGQDLADEQARYDAAIAARNPLGTPERARLDHMKLIGVTPNFAAILTPAFTVTELPSQTLHGHTDRIFQAEFAPPTTHPERYILWINTTDPSGPWVERYIFTALASADPAAEPLDRQTEDLTLFDNLPVATHRITDSRLTQDGDTIRVHGETEYTSYRRFRTEIRLSPANVLPSSPSDQP